MFRSRYRLTTLLLAGLWGGFMTALLTVGMAGAAPFAAASGAGLIVVQGGPLPLPVFLDALGRQSGRSVLVVPGVPADLVAYQFDRVPFDVAWSAVVAAHGLESCRSAAVLAVGRRPALDGVCRALGAPLALEESPAPLAEAAPGFGTRLALASTAPQVAPAPLAPVAETPAVPAPPTVAARYGVRIRLLEIADNASSGGGVDWSQGLLGRLLGAAASVATGGLYNPSELTTSISALEQRGLARKVDDVRLVLTDGRAAVFRSGGSLQLSLVGGQSNVERQVQYGLALNLLATAQPDGSIELATSAELSSPVSVTNPALLDLSARTVTGSPLLRPGSGVVLAAWSSTRQEEAGSGVPGVASVPVVGWLAGRASSSSARSTVVVTVELDA